MAVRGLKDHPVLRPGAAAPHLAAMGSACAEGLKAETPTLTHKRCREGQWDTPAWVSWC